jgi:hypothetical protein
MMDAETKPEEMPQENVVLFPSPAIESIEESGAPASIAEPEAPKKRRIPKDKVLPVLLADLIKGRKSDTLGPIRLASVIRHIGSNENASKIWMDHAFHILLEDYRAAKSPKIKAVREASLVLFLKPGQTRGMSVETAKAIPQMPQAVTPVETDETKDMTPQQKENYAAYVDRQRQERFRKDPQKSADDAAAMIKKAIAERGWNGVGEFSCDVPITTNVSWLEAACRRAQIRFSAIRYNIALRNPTINKSTGLAEADRDGKPGNKWQVTLS